MVRRRRPVVFDVYLNGRRLCRAGVGESGVLSAIINWVSGGTTRDGRRRKAQLDLHVGGLRHDDRGSDIHPSWVDVNLKPGDQISVRVGQGDRIDRPVREKVWTAEDTRRSEENYLNHLAPQDGWVRRGARRSQKGRHA